jgi:signal transduction histidine kinase/DNA-binding response OmpR family regulator/HAMP domain-containing protein
VLAFQLSIERINELTQNIQGMGETGDVFMVGTDLLMRTNSRFSQESTILKTKVDTEATRNALQGLSGVAEVPKDYRGKAVLASYQPMHVGGAKWGLIVKIDQAEAFAAIDHLLYTVSAITGVCALLVIFIGIYFSNALAKPIQAMTTVARQLAAGNLKQTINIQSRNEIGLMAKALSDMIGNLQQIIGDITQVSRGLAVGDLRSRVSSEFPGDFAEIKQATNLTSMTLQELINETNQAFSQLARGNMAVRIQREFPGDFLQIKQAANEMAQDLQVVIGETSRVLEDLSKGKMDARVNRDFAGDFGEIKQSLENTAVKLAQATAENERQNWLKGGQSQLSATISGDQDLKQLAENIIHFLVPYVNAQIGAIYLLEEGADNEPQLRLFASHAYVRRKTAATVFKMGEGLVGEAAFERTLFMVSQPPEDYIQIQSGLGAGIPRAILVTPFLHENELKGVIELASFETFTDIQMDFLRQIMPVVAIAMNTAESRTKMKVLLQRTQEQAEVLQKQTAELELQKANLQGANEELQSQSEELQSQTEELQAQQEELRQTNEALEMRGKELERQKEAVRKQNEDLEKAQAVVQAKAEELAIASKYKSEFLANMSHELRTPLNSLLILAQMLADNKEGRLSEKQVEYARTIHGSGKDLLSLINEILDLSKVEAGKIDLHPESCGIKDLIASLEQKFRHMADDKRLSFKIQLAPNLPDSIYTDAQRMKQIINNLLSNAFKFTHDGGVTLEIRRPLATEDLSRSGLEAARSIAICVSDTGIGIPKEKQKTVFEAFQQADGSTSRKYGGTGLGLSISKQLAQVMGGEIQLHSEPDQGSRFTVFLPERFTLRADQESSEIEAVMPLSRRQPAAAAPQFAEAAPAPSYSPSPAPVFSTLTDDREKLKGGSKSLLVIEDDPTFAKLLMELAREKGFLCLHAADGQTGLQLVESYEPSAIILDVGLPQVDGWTVMERLKENADTRHIPVHFVSGADYRHEARRMGAVGYSLKPVSMMELSDAFSKIEQVISKSVKNLLLVTDNPKHREAILEILGNDALEIVDAPTQVAALQALDLSQQDCLILDVSLEHNKGIRLLEKLAGNDRYAQVPVLIYADRELDSAEDAILKQMADLLTIKSIRSPERLLDEATLFLHQIEAKLPQPQQQTLRKMHDKENILKGKKILIVDDDMRNTFALSAILGDKGVDVVVAANGREGMSLLAKNPDTVLILMDIMMPEMDGYEAMRKIREQNMFRKLPIIALTAKAMKGDRAKCIEAGASDYLAKPVDTNKLLSLLRVWLYQ